jgi:hypothetical protein
VETAAAYRIINESLWSALGSNGPLEKHAAEGLNDYTRRRVLEDGFRPLIIPDQTVTNDELDIRVDTDKPLKVFEMEPESAAAVSVPLGTLPTNIYINQPRYEVRFQRIMTRRYNKEVDELRTTRADLRQIVSDNAVKEVHTEDDTKFIDAVVECVIAPGVPSVYTQEVQWEEIDGPINRSTLLDALKVMARTDCALQAETLLCNHITLFDVMKMWPVEAGNDLSETMLRKGTIETNLLNRRWIATIKRRLVPDGRIHYFANAKFMGKYCVLEDLTMYVERKFFLLEFFAYKHCGGTIANPASVAIVDFLG